MLNINGNLLDKLDENEFYLFSILLNYGAKSRPSNTVLMKRTGWAMQKLQKVKKSLEKKNLLEITAKINIEQKGRASNEYTITTPLASNFKGKKKEQKHTPIHDFQVIEIHLLENHLLEFQLDDFQLDENHTGIKVLKVIIIEKIKELLKKEGEAHTSETLPSSFSQNKIEELEAKIKILETPAEILHQNHKPILTPTQNLALSAFEQLAERKENSNWTSLDMTLNGGYKLPSSWSELFQNEVVGYWIYMEGKRGNTWGAARTISGQVDIINAFLKTNSEQEIIDSIQDCVNRGDNSFNPEWTKNRKKAQPSTATPTYELPKFENQDESDRYFMGKFTKYRPHLDNRLCNTVYRERMQKKELPALIYELEQEHPHLLKL